MGLLSKAAKIAIAARKRKAATDKKINARPSQKKKRADCNKKRAQAKNKR